jgi:hypothetical protein
MIIMLFNGPFDGSQLHIKGSHVPKHITLAYEANDYIKHIPDQHVDLVRAYYKYTCADGSTYKFTYKP